jgi:hypothetical protein
MWPRCFAYNLCRLNLTGLVQTRVAEDVGPADVVDKSVWKQLLQKAERANRGE